MSEENKPLIFEVSSNNFEDLVIHNSSHLPVLVEFMGVWSEPCIKTEYAISDLAKEFPGGFIFAKIDIDEQEDLMKQFSIENVPTILVFQDGKEVQREEGELQSEELRVLLKHYGIYRESDELRKQARDKHMSGDTQSAIMLLTQAIQSDPSNARVALDMAQVFLDIDEFEQAEALFSKLPESAHKSDIGVSIATQLHFVGLAKNTLGFDKLQDKIISTPNDYQAHFDMAICLFAQHDIDNGMERLFYVHENNPNFGDGAAREMIGTVCNMLMKSNPDKSNSFRRKLSSSINN